MITKSELEKLTESDVELGDLYAAERVANELKSKLCIHYINWLDIKAFFPPLDSSNWHFRLIEEVPVKRGYLGKLIFGDHKERLLAKIWSLPLEIITYVDDIELENAAEEIYSETKGYVGV